MLRWYAAFSRWGYALGIPKLKTILRIVLPRRCPASSPALLPRARLAGETAPVLLGGRRQRLHNSNPSRAPGMRFPVHLDHASLATSTGPLSPGRPHWTLVALVLARTVAGEAAVAVAPSCTRGFSSMAKRNRGSRSHRSTGRSRRSTASRVDRAQVGHARLIGSLLCGKSTYLRSITGCTRCCPVPGGGKLTNLPPGHLRP